MPRRKKSKKDELIDEMLKDSAPQELLKELTAAVVNRSLDAELTEHLDYEQGEAPPEEQSNRRNGHRKKTVRTSHGKVDVKVPRDRDGSFEPQIIKRYQRAIPDFDEKILAMYARGMSTRDIRAFLEEQYGVDVSPDLISRVTDSVVDELKQWQQRPLESLYPIVYLDALVVKIRSQGLVQNKSMYLVIGVDSDGERSVLGLWVQKTEGAKFWLSILNELRHRGVEDILFLCADGLKGLPEAVEASFPQTVFQTCVVHLIRASTRLVPWRDKRALCNDLQLLYKAKDIESAESALDDFDEKWGEKYPMVSKAWRERFVEWTPFLGFSPEVRHAVYTTNVIEATNRQVRKVLKTKGHLPSDEAALKLVWLVLRCQSKMWNKPRKVRTWPTVRLHLAMHFGDRFPVDL